MARSQRHVVVRGKVQVEGRGEIDPLIPRIARIGEQESRLAISGNGNTQPGRIEDRHTLELYHHVTRAGKRIALCDGNAPGFDAPRLGSRRASSQLCRLDGQRVVRPLQAGGRSAKFRRKQDEIDILQAHPVRGHVEYRRSAGQGHARLGEEQAIRKRDLARPVDLANQRALADNPAIALLEGNRADELRVSIRRMRQPIAAQTGREGCRRLAERRGKLALHVHAGAVCREARATARIQFRPRDPMRIDGRNGPCARRDERNGNDESGEPFHSRSMTNAGRAS